MLDFLATRVSGDARCLALRLAPEPFDPEAPPVHPREFAETLRMSVAEYERAWSELRDPRVGWIHGHHFDRPMLKPDALPRKIVLADQPRPQQPVLNNHHPKGNRK